LVWTTLSFQEFNHDIEAFQLAMCRLNITVSLEKFSLRGISCHPHFRRRWHFVLNFWCDYRYSRVFLTQRFSAKSVFVFNTLVLNCSRFFIITVAFSTRKGFSFICSSTIKLVLPCFLSFSSLLEFFLSFLIPRFHLTGFNTFSSTVIPSCIDRCDPFSTKDTIGGITGSALQELAIFPHVKEIVLVYL
jgi:hypothetical protein